MTVPNRTVGSIRSTLLVLAFAALCAGRAEAADPEDVLYAEYQVVLASFVNDSGLVDYAGLQQNRAGLDAYVARLGRVSLENWKPSAQKAFWINAYNGLTLRIIIDNYPIRPRFLASLAFPRNSIRQIDGAWDEIRFRVAQGDRTLDQIEHAVLRKRFDEPRIHFALVCAALGCPPLRREPYRGDRLGEQLQEQAARFVEDPGKVRIDSGAGIVYLSSIFKWFGSDFRKGGSTRRVSFPGQTETVQAVLNFLLPFLSPEEQAFLQAHPFQVEYLSYDWSLNGQD